MDDDSVIDSGYRIRDDPNIIFVIIWHIYYYDTWRKPVLVKKRRDIIFCNTVEIECSVEKIYKYVCML